MANYRSVKLDKATCQQITAEIMQTYDLYKLAIERSNGWTLLRIPPYKATWSQSALHKHEWRDKRVDWPNREQQMYKYHEHLARMSALFSREFSMSHIVKDLIIHNHWSNESALMTRCGTDLSHQYGIFCSESQMSFLRNATWAGSEEGFYRLTWNECGKKPYI